jgi:hypothetical protein
MKIITRENGHLWLVVDEDEKIVYASLFRDRCEEYLQRNRK